MAGDSSYIGKHIGNYRIIAEINSGSCGSIYQGKHIIFEDEPIVAIKLLHAHLRSPQEREQFIQEARLLKKPKHPHILPIIDAGIQDGLPYANAYYGKSVVLERLGRSVEAQQAYAKARQLGYNE